MARTKASIKKTREEEIKESFPETVLQADIEQLPIVAETVIKKMGKENHKKYTLVAVSLAVLVVGLGTLAAYFGVQVYSLKSSSSTSTQYETDKLVADVSKLIVLPTDEEPTIATITDLKPLAGQAFFANAKIGDKVFIYTKAKKAILYSPSTNKIVEVAPLSDAAVNDSSLQKKTTTEAKR